MNKVFCITGMPGSGKSTVSDYLVSKSFGFVRFGQIVIDEVKRLKLLPTEENERKIRESLREKFGKGVMAERTIPTIDKLLQNGSVVADGLYSFTEYKILKKHYKDKMVVVAVWAPPEVRYARISERNSDNDPNLRFRKFTVDEAQKRDHAEIENLEKGGPIAMADITLINTKDTKHLYSQIDPFLMQTFK